MTETPGTGTVHVVRHVRYSRVTMHGDGVPMSTPGWTSVDKVDIFTLAPEKIRA